MRVLHLEDNASDALLVQRTLERHGFNARFVSAASEAEYRSALESGQFDLILADSSVPGFSGRAALDLARFQCPHVPFVFVSGASGEAQELSNLEAGAADFVPKDHLWQLVVALRRVFAQSKQVTPNSALQRQNRAMQRLVAAVQELSLARNLEKVMSVVRKTARELTGADGATFILRDGDKCFYADEDAIAPLWKGQRFPMTACISGWAMLNRQAAIIEDIYKDPRIPVDAYRPTFVKSLVMVPIRTAEPVGAIGNYWARSHLASADEVELLQALANTTAVAMENVQVYSELEKRVEDRTLQLRATNQELEAFSYSVSHDLKAPLVGINAYSMLLEEHYSDRLDDKGRVYLERISKESRRMTELIDDLLRFAQFARLELHKETVSLSKLAREVVMSLQTRNPSWRAEFEIEDGLEVEGDAGLLRVVMENLLSNACKYSAKNDRPLVVLGAADQPDGARNYFVRDNGVGFDMRQADRLFTPFHRLHREAEFSGHGVGLATVQRIVHRHGGRLWAESEPGKGATFYFTLGLERTRAAF